MTKEGDSCIKSCWDRFVDTEVAERKMSPFGKRNVQMADIISITGIFLHCLEKEFTFTDHFSQVNVSQNIGRIWDLQSKKISNDQELI